MFFGTGLDVFSILAILGLPIYFICQWIFKKLIKSEKVRYVTTWTTTILTTLSLYIGLILLFFFIISYHSNHEFTTEKWLADREKRYELSQHIIYSKMLIGKNKSEVAQILGIEGNKDQYDHWSYYLGFRPGFANIDPDILDVYFKDGIVIKVGQHES